MQPPRDFLLFRLWGPMSSWGSIAVGEQRQTWQRPSRSAVLGIVAAALGIERSNAAAHDPLERRLGFAVRMDASGSAMRDYHTAQAPSSEAKRRWHSRHDEIHGAKTLNTILSERSYHAGMNAVVALWLRDDAEPAVPPLADIADKLRHPIYALYLGRKASPLGLPLDPLLASGAALDAAFTAFDERDAKLIGEGKEARRHRLTWVLESTCRSKSSSMSFWLDPADIAVAGPHRLHRQTRRRDGIRDRRTWTFNDHDEVEVIVEAAP